MSYIENLVQQISIFPEADIQKPDGKRESSDSLLGEVPMELRKLWTIRGMKVEEHNILAIQFNKTIRPDGPPTAEFVKQSRILMLLREETKLLDRLFWLDLQKHFQKELSDLEGSQGSMYLYEDWTCGLRKEPEEETGLFDLGGIVVMKVGVR